MPTMEQWDRFNNLSMLLFHKQSMALHRPWCLHPMVKLPWIHDYRKR